MSKGEALRGFVNERLTAAAEEIFAQFERTIAEYEEELRRYKDENQRKQALLESVLSLGPGPGLNHGPNQFILETSQIKDEPEEKSVHHLQVIVHESNAVCVKTEESSLLQQTELKQEETQGEDVSSQTERDTEHSSDTDTIFAQISHLNLLKTKHRDERPCVKMSPGPQTEDEPVEQRDQPLQVCVPEPSAACGGAEGKIHQCPVCNQRLKGRVTNQRKMRQEELSTVGSLERTVAAQADSIVPERSKEGEEERKKERSKRRKQPRRLSAAPPNELTFSLIGNHTSFSSCSFAPNEHLDYNMQGHT
ncbi:hypothetical protein WMY93_002128 [Mugilogobius chulae]|uniref:Uncharacterized protein n=1 Tax=Mugilogobius chulae TaxID=88201 RepID=A0AAW0Q3M8_9GOBI